MQVLEILLYLCGTASYVVLACLAVKAYGRMTDYNNLIKGVAVTAAKIYAIVSTIKLQQTFTTLGRMRQSLDNLTQAEEFEKAAKLKTAIEEAEKLALADLKKYEEIFGENVSVNIL